MNKLLFKTLSTVMLLFIQISKLSILIILEVVNFKTNSRHLKKYVFLSYIFLCFG